MSAQLIDSHCHLDLIDQAEAGHDLDSLLDNARRNQVSHMLCVSVDPEHFPSVRGLAEFHDNVYASAGIHPNTELAAPIGIPELLRMADHPKVIAIGETGLDYYRCEGDLEWQRQRFRDHIAVARQMDKPLIIHTREARRDTLRILREEGAEQVGGVMHCFAEDWETASAALDIGFYISFSGIVTFNSAKELKEVAKRVPLDRMLVETDAPWLAPVPYRGKTNQPAYVRHVAEHIAELRGVAPAIIAAATTDNFFKLFRAARA